MVVAQIKSVAHAYLSPYIVAEEAEAVPADPEVEAETEAAPVEEASPAEVPPTEQANSSVPEISAKVNGVAPAAGAPTEEQASQPSSQSATPPPPEAEAAPAPAPATDQSWAEDQPEASTEVRSNPLSVSMQRVFLTVS